MRALQRLVLRLALLAAVALVLPTSSVQPTTISLTTIGTVESVDIDDDVLWVLALGSEAGPGEDVMTGLTDAIQMIGVRPGTGRAVAIGLPRDLWIEGRSMKLNAVLASFDTDAVVEEVQALLGITPDLVLVTGTQGFVSMMGDLGPVEVDSPADFTTDDGEVRIREGSNTLGAREALSYVTTRDELDQSSDFERVANHQRLLLAVLARLRVAGDEEGFLERMTLSALGSLDTNLSPSAAFRVIAALTTIDPARTDACIIRGTFGEVLDQDVVYADETQAEDVGVDAEEDARLQGGCRDGS